MAKFVVEETVHAPLATVFAISTDFANCDEVIEAITAIEMLTDGEVGVGTRFKETRTVFKRDATEEMEVVAFDPPRSYTLGAESHGSRYRSQFLFDEVDGGTRVQMTFEAEPLTFFAKIMSVLTKAATKSLANMILKDLQDLKRAAEAAAND